jgi:predicted Zn-dependent peptidase
MRTKTNRENKKQTREETNRHGANPVLAFPYPWVPRPLIAPHAEPRMVCTVDKEHTKTSVTVTFKYEANKVSTPGGFFRKTVEDAFKLALDNRLYKIMRRTDPPFFSAACSMEEATRTTSLFSVQIVCEEGKAMRGLEAGLRELARARLHGFSPQELRIAAAKQLAEAEQLFVERDQTYCTSLRDELVGHFLRGELVVGAEEEARLSKSCTERMTCADLHEYADKLRINRSCVIRAMEGRAATREDDISAAVATIQAEEDAGEITENAMFKVPETLIEKDGLMTAGSIVDERTFPNLGFTVVGLANGMRVAMKTTNFLDDQVLVRCFARGGMSEVSRAEHLDSLYANTIASELGMYGFKPEVLHDIMAGKRCEMSAKTGTYTRRVDGDTSPTDIESGLQLLHILFTSDVSRMLVPEELEAVLRMQEQAIRNRRRDPASVYNETIRHLVYGRTFQSKPLQVRDVRRMKPSEACRHFNANFSDPAEFTVVLVGAFDEGKVRPMLEKYLGSIPPPKVPRPRITEVKPVPFTFPAGVINKDLRVPMVEPMSMASITFPVNIPNPDYDTRLKTVPAVTLEGSAALTKEKLLCVFASSIIERRLLALLRFKFGEIYTCSAGTSFAYQDPAARGATLRGDVMINFSCDPSAGHRLAELAMEDVRAMQRDGPTAEEVATAVEVETRALEVRLQENAYWREYYEALHNSRLVPLMGGDLDALFAMTERVRGELMRGLTPEMIQAHMQRCLKADNRVVVVLRPQRPLWQRLCLPSPVTPEGLAVLTCVGAAVMVLLRHATRRA